MIEDRLEIIALLNLHGHLCDEGALDRFDEVFTDDVVYDVSPMGQAPILGLDALREAAFALGDRNPVAHLVTNIVIETIDGGVATARSKGLAITKDGRAASVTYRDVLQRTHGGWRVSRREITPRTIPLNGVHHGAAHST